MDEESLKSLNAYLMHNPFQIPTETSPKKLTAIEQLEALLHNPFQIPTETSPKKLTAIEQLEALLHEPTSNTTHAINYQISTPEIAHLPKPFTPLQSRTYIVVSDEETPFNETKRERNREREEKKREREREEKKREREEKKRERERDEKNRKRDRDYDLRHGDPVNFKVDIYKQELEILMQKDLIGKVPNSAVYPLYVVLDAIRYEKPYNINHEINITDCIDWAKLHTNTEYEKLMRSYYFREMSPISSAISRHLATLTVEKNKAFNKQRYLDYHSDILARINLTVRLQPSSRLWRFQLKRVLRLILLVKEPFEPNQFRLFLDLICKRKSRVVSVVGLKNRELGPEPSGSGFLLKTTLAAKLL